MKKFRLILMALVHTWNLCAEIHWTDQHSQLPNDPRDLYIDLLIKTVANTIYEDAAYVIEYANGKKSYMEPEILNRRLTVPQKIHIKKKPYEAQRRETGLDHPLTAHTMIGLKRLENVRDCVVDVIKNNIPGDCVETGVWRGGATILMRGILKAYGDEMRKIWVADSFAGLPLPNLNKYPQDKGLELLSAISYLAVPLEVVQNNFQKYGLLDNQVIFLKGFFSDTLPTAPIEQIAVLRLDGDLYESTMDALVHLYPKLSAGGYLIIDDYYAIQACQQAVSDYRQMHGIQEEMIHIDSEAIYWKKL